MNTLDELFSDLDPLHDELTQLEERFIDKEQSHEISFARATLGAKGSNEATRKAEATLATQNEAWELRVAKQILKSAERKMRILERKIDIQRTREANLRTVR